MVSRLIYTWSSQHQDPLPLELIPTPSGRAWEGPTAAPQLYVTQLLQHTQGSWGIEGVCRVGYSKACVLEKPPITMAQQIYLMHLWDGAQWYFGALQIVVHKMPSTYYTLYYNSSSYIHSKTHYTGGSRIKVHNYVTIYVMAWGDAKTCRQGVK